MTPVATVLTTLALSVFPPSPQDSVDARQAILRLEELNLSVISPSDQLLRTVCTLSKIRTCVLRSSIPTTALCTSFIARPAPTLLQHSSGAWWDGL